MSEESADGLGDRLQAALDVRPAQLSSAIRENLLQCVRTSRVPREPRHSKPERAKAAPRRALPSQRTFKSGK